MLSWNIDLSVNRRTYLALCSVGFLGSIAGCTGRDATGTTVEGGSDVETTTQSPDSTENEGTGVEPSTATGEDIGDSEIVIYTIKIKTDSKWSGEVGSLESMKSMNGTGSRTFEFEAPKEEAVTASFRKQEETNHELMVTILHDGAELAQSSTSEKNGITLASTSGNTDDEPATGESSPFSVQVEYSGEWTGTIVTGGTLKSIGNSGPETTDIIGSPDKITVAVEKVDDDNEGIIVKLLKSGQVVEKNSKTEGSVLISYRTD